MVNTLYAVFFSGICITCIMSLLVHLKIQPFLVQTCNVLEFISLSILGGISIMNLLKAVYFEAGENNVPDYFNFSGCLPIIYVFGNVLLQYETPCNLLGTEARCIVYHSIEI